MAGSLMDISFQAFRKRLETGIMFGWPIQRSDSGGCGTRMRSPVFVRNPRCVVSSAIRRHASLLLYDAQKKHLRRLQSSPLVLVRPTHAACSRPVLRRPAHLSGDRGAPGAVQELRAREARAPRFPGEQPFLYQALCLLRRPSLPASDDQGCCAGVEPRLGFGEDAGDAVHARATRPRGHARPQGDRHRRDLDPQGPHLSDRGERPHARPSDLVRR